MLGSGVGSWSIRYFGLDDSRYPHNLILEVLVEFGLVGLLLLATVAVAAARRISVHRLREDPVLMCIAMLCINTFVAAQSAVFAGFEKLVELNLKVVRATLDEVAQKSQQAADVKDPQEAAAFASGLLQPGAEKALAYTKHVYDIVAGVQGNLVKLTEEQIAEGQQQLTDAVEQFSKNAPTGSESAVALIKSSLATATAPPDVARSAVIFA